jgi:hypothetical protein
MTFRGGNQAGRIRVGFKSGRLGQFDLLKEIGSDQFTYCIFSDF